MTKLAVKHSYSCVLVRDGTRAWEAVGARLFNQKYKNDWTGYIDKHCFFFWRQGLHSSFADDVGAWNES